MNKTKLITIFSLAGAIILSGCQSSQKAQAATWHHGTPKALLGTYQAKLDMKSAHDGGDVLQISKSYTSSRPADMSEAKTIHIKYKKVGKYYRLVGHTIKNGMVLGGHWDAMYYRKGKAIRTTSTSHFKKHGFKGEETYYKTHHIKSRYLGDYKK